MKSCGNLQELYIPFEQYKNKNMYKTLFKDTYHNFPQKLQVQKEGITANGGALILI